MTEQESSAAYRIALLAGAALPLLVFLSLVMRWEVSTAQTILAVFGSALFATPVIAKVTLSKDGFALETVKVTTKAITEALSWAGWQPAPQVVA